jgi:hypothetical protein
MVTRLNLQTHTHPKYKFKVYQRLIFQERQMGLSSREDWVCARYGRRQERFDFTSGWVEDGIANGSRGGYKSYISTEA